MGSWSKEARKRWFKKWYQKPENKIKHRLAVRNWMKKNRDKVNVWHRNYRKKNPEAIRIIQRRHYAKNRESILRKELWEYHLNLPNSRERSRISARQWRNKNRNKYNRYARLRRYRMKNGTWKPFSKFYKYKNVK